MHEDKRLFDQLKKNSRLPTPRGVVVRLLELTRDPDVSIREIVEVVGGDSALCGKILRFANSPMAGIPREVTSVHQAVSMIGTSGVCMIALSLAMVGSDSKHDCAGFDADRSWGQSMACAASAQALAVRTKDMPPLEAFTAGVLSQIGRSMLACGAPQRYGRVLQQSSNQPRDLPALELEEFGCTYAEVGAHMLGEWGIPAHIVDGVRQFRMTFDDVADMPPTCKLLDAAEAAANVMCPASPEATPPPDDFCRLMASYFDYPTEQALLVLEELAELTAEMRSVMDIPDAMMRSTADIQQDVRERVAELTLAASLQTQTMQQRNRQLQEAATTDRLTGLKNRAAFDEKLQFDLLESAGSEDGITLMMVDIDRFKQFNDKHGHLAGDFVLEGVAKTLHYTARKDDFVARYGGEEFTVLLSHANAQGALALAERLRAAVAEQVAVFDGEKLSVTISIGVGLVPAVTRDMEPADVIRAADRQLYAAKQAGRNCVKATIIEPKRLTADGHSPPGTQQLLGDDQQASTPPDTTRGTKAVAAE